MIWFSPKFTPEDQQDVILRLRAYPVIPMGGWYDDTGKFYVWDNENPIGTRSNNVAYPVDDVLAWTPIDVDHTDPIEVPTKLFHVVHNGQDRGDFSLADTVAQFPWYKDMDQDDPLSLNIGGTEIHITPHYGYEIPEVVDDQTWILVTEGGGDTHFLYAVTAGSLEEAGRKVQDHPSVPDQGERLLYAFPCGTGTHFLGAMNKNSMASAIVSHEVPDELSD